MGIIVNLQEIIEGMDMQFEGTNTYLNRKTGEIISISEEDLRAAEDDDTFEHLPEWHQEAMKVAIDVIENYGDYNRLPTNYDINEYEMMEDFCFTIIDERSKNMLLNAIQGRGAFRRFKDHIYRLGIEKKWYAFREGRYKEIAIDWCKNHNIHWIE
ncbi:hypothetical protein PB1_10859 [Bacillus methanolicus PB1]|uniref:Uncharacterized protein n=1 Tax=Bacillus methanolicus PB1 TaxID=997296 RepID=I3DUY5_BACMT|nr:UPF0158 family protein [Bacillus methanolicus]EIJ78056.1 hypothetical protein PB1_10859 [Bacillus methanolicus PB1]